MGKRVFDQGEQAWPEGAPFRTPVYVLTNRKRDLWVRPGSTTFQFINEGPEIALKLAQESAGSRDVRIADGADVIQHYLNLGAIDELEITVGASPVRPRAPSLRESERARAGVSNRPRSSRYGRHAPALRPQARPNPSFERPPPWSA